MANHQYSKQFSILARVKQSQVQVKHIYKEANMVADWLAKYGHSTPAGLVTTTCFHVGLQKVIWEDDTGRDFVRKDA